uniref:Uncharacterized protein n=1 Tax=Glossina pallidipes TaxID=7398 RepID=A0A1A9ZHM2_GLOPL
MRYDVEVLNSCCSAVIKGDEASRFVFFTISMLPAVLVELLVTIVVAIVLVVITLGFFVVVLMGFGVVVVVAVVVVAAVVVGVIVVLVVVGAAVVVVVVVLVVVVVIGFFLNEAITIASIIHIPKSLGQADIVHEYNDRVNHSLQLINSGLRKGECHLKPYKFGGAIST